jgi:hypothetical protein
VDKEIPHTKIEGDVHMSYKIKLEDVLLPTWEKWDGAGCYDIPGKNITLNNGLAGCILVDTQGIGIYNKGLDDINNGDGNDEGELFIDFAETLTEADKLKAHISVEDVEEAKIVYSKYIDRDNSWSE